MNTRNKNNKTFSLQCLLHNLSWILDVLSLQLSTSDGDPSEEKMTIEELLKITTKSRVSRETPL